MALTIGSKIEMTVTQIVLGQTMANIWGYEIKAIPGTPTPVQIAEAYWNHVKATYRAIVPGVFGNVFRSVRLREMNDPNGAYAEYDIPIADQVGTRSASGDILPPFTAVGVRMVVGTRVTRPGQKRLVGLTEADQNAGVLVAGTVAIYKAFVDVAAGLLTLGAPAAATILQSQVFSKDNGGFIIASQDVQGTIVNTNVSTQNSRKFGRGS